MYQLVDPAQAVQNHHTSEFLFALYALAALFECSGQHHAAARGSRCSGILGQETRYTHTRVCGRADNLVVRPRCWPIEPHMGERHEVLAWHGQSKSV